MINFFQIYQAYVKKVLFGKPGELFWKKNFVLLLFTKTDEKWDQIEKYYLVSQESFFEKKNFLLLFPKNDEKLDEIKKYYLVSQENFFEKKKFVLLLFTKTDEKWGQNFQKNVKHLPFKKKNLLSHRFDSSKTIISHLFSREMFWIISWLPQEALLKTKLPAKTRQFRYFWIFLLQNTFFSQNWFVNLSEYIWIFSDFFLIFESFFIELKKRSPRNFSNSFLKTGFSKIRKNSYVFGRVDESSLG